MTADGPVESRSWVWTWESIDPDATYIACALNMPANGSGAMYLGRPQLLKGWQVSRLMPKCYAAIACPGLPPTTSEGKV